MTVNKQAFFLFVIVFLSGFGEAFAQLDTVHWIPPLHSRDPSQAKGHYIYLSTPKSNAFNVTIKDGAGNKLASSPVQLSNGSPKRIKIGGGQNPATELMVPKSRLYQVLSDKGLKLTAPEPFYVNGRYLGRNQAASVTTKGLSALGKEFRVGVMPQPANRFNRNFVTSIMAVSDSTDVTVKDYQNGVAFETAAGNTAVDSVTIRLDKGETFVLSGYTDVQANQKGFVGALIKANNGVVVNTGNWLGTISSPANRQDVGLDQIVPTKNTGRKYAVVEGAGLNKQERPMVVAWQDNTKVFVNGTVETTLQAGDNYLVPNARFGGTNNRNMYIRTTKPAYVYQFLAGSTNPATPGMNFLAPLNCGLPQEVDLMPSVNSIGNTTFNGEVFAITKKGSTLKVDGSSIAASKSEALTGNNQWVTYKLSTSKSDVSVSSDNALLAGFYGENTRAGYGGLFSGFSLDLEADFAYQDTISYSRETSGCFNDTIDVAFTGEKEPGTEFRWEFGKASALNPSGNPGQFAQTNQGPYQLIYRSQDYDSVVRDSIQLVVKDGNCKDSITKAIRIFEVAPRQPATIQNVTIPKDRVVKVDFKGLDVRDLNRYEILRRKGGSGAFIQVDEVVNPDTPDKRFTVLDTVNTRDTQLCYTIATVRGCKKTAYSDTFCATQLGGRPSNKANQLTWQRFSGYPIDSQLVLKKAGSGYDTIARLAGSATTYTDQPLACNVAKSYKILSLEKGGDRTTLSDSVRLTPFDSLAPGAPTIQKLSILSDTKARLNWLRTDSSVTRHELWLKARGQAWRIIDTAGLQNTYTYTGLDTRDSQYCARIAGIDSCSANRSAFSTPHCAVQLEGTPGNLENILTWQAYEGFNNPSYEVQAGHRQHFRHHLHGFR
jgi:hypothetical protein